MILFLHIEKSAGTSLSYYLKSKFGTSFLDLYPLENGTYITDKDIQNAIKYNFRPYILSGHKIYLNKINLNIFDYVIITCRDPKKRLISHINHLEELRRLDCLDPKEIFKNDTFVQLQYKKFGGINAHSILSELYENKKLIVINQITFKEDLRFFIEDNFEIPQLNIRQNKHINRAYLSEIENQFNDFNKEEIKIYQYISALAKEYGKNCLQFSAIKAKNINVRKANFYRKYVRLPFLIIKYFIKHLNILPIKNMSGYYFCNK